MFFLLPLFGVGEGSYKQLLLSVSCKVQIYGPNPQYLI